jgi:hypothetical protein
LKISLGHSHFPAWTFCRLAALNNQMMRRVDPKIEDAD